MTNVVVNRYNKILADYFEKKPLYLDEITQKKPNVRKLVEQPWQQTKGKMWDEVTQTLCNINFMEAKVTAKMIFELVTDFNAVLQITSAKEEYKSHKNYGQNTEQLAVYAEALNRERDNLAYHPQLTWQQLYNRLWFYKGPSKETIKKELIRYASGGIPPWIELKTPIRESAGLITKFQAHEGVVWDCTVSPDGKLFASVGHDGIVKLWSLESYQEISTLYHDEFKNKKWIEPFRSSLLNKYPDSPEWVGNVIDSIQKGANKVTDCVFNASGCLLAVKLGSETIVVYDSHSGNECWIADNLPSFLGQTKINPNGYIEMSSSAAKLVVDLDREILLVPRTDHFEAIGINEGKFLGRWQIRPAGFAVHEISSTIVVAEVNSPGRIFVLDPKTGDNALLFQDGIDGICSCAVVPGHPFIIIGGKRGQVTVLNGSTRATVSQRQAHNHAINLCLVSSNGRYLVTGDGGSLKLWNLPFLEEYMAFADFIEPVVFSPDSRYIVATSIERNNDLVVWGLETASEISRLIGHAGQVRCCAFTPDGACIISGDDTGSVRVWKSLNSKAEVNRSIHSDFIRTISFSPDGKSLATADDSGFIQLWDANSLTQTTSYKASKFTKWAIGPDGAKLLSVNEGLMALINAADGKVLASLSAPIVDSPNWARCSIAPDGLLAVVRTGQKMLIWDLRTMKAIEVKEDIFGLTGDCTYTPDAKSILICEGPTVSIRSADNGCSRGLIRDAGYQPREISCCAVSPAGEFVVTGDSEGRIRIWDWPPDSMTYTGFIGNLLPRLEMSNGKSDIVSCSVGIYGRVIASACAKGKIYLWDSMTGTELGILPLSGVSRVALHPLDPVLVIGTFSGDIYFAYLHHLPSITHPKIIVPPDPPFQIHFERPQPIRVVPDAPKSDPVEWRQRVHAAEHGWKPIRNIDINKRMENSIIIDFTTHFTSFVTSTPMVKTKADNEPNQKVIVNKVKEQNMIELSDHDEKYQSIFIEAEKAFAEERWNDAFKIYLRLIQAGKFDENQLRFNMAMCRINMLKDNDPQMVSNINVLMKLLKDKGKNNEAELVSAKLQERLLLLKSRKNWWDRMFK